MDAYREVAMYTPTLIESRRPLASSGAISGGAVSFVAHAALITAAVYLTLTATKAVEQARRIVDITLLTEEAPPPPRAALPTLAPPPGFATLTIPNVILTEIPAPSQAPFDPTRFSGVGLEAPAPVVREVAARAAEPAAVYDAEMIEELPERVGGAVPRYPPMLRAAKIPGQATIECVVDTLGRVEPGSVRSVRATHALFAQAAAEAVATWEFRPGRIAGRAVRARVNLPVNFSL